jgi:hypothetical protein
MAGKKKLFPTESGKYPSRGLVFFSWTIVLGTVVPLRTKLQKKFNLAGSGAYAPVNTVILLLFLESTYQEKVVSKGKSYTFAPAVYYGGKKIKNQLEPDTRGNRRAMTRGKKILGQRNTLSTVVTTEIHSHLT